MGREA